MAVSPGAFGYEYARVCQSEHRIQLHLHTSGEVDAAWGEACDQAEQYGVFLYSLTWKSGCIASESNYGIVMAARGKDVSHHSVGKGGVNPEAPAVAPAFVASRYAFERIHVLDVLFLRRHNTSVRLVQSSRYISITAATLTASVTLSSAGSKLNTISWFPAGTLSARST